MKGRRTDADAHPGPSLPIRCAASLLGLVAGGEIRNGDGLIITRGSPSDTGGGQSIELMAAYLSRCLSEGGRPVVRGTDVSSQT